MKIKSSIINAKEISISFFFLMLLSHSLLIVYLLAKKSEPGQRSQEPLVLVSLGNSPTRLSLIVSIKDLEGFMLNYQGSVKLTHWAELSCDVQITM